MLRSLRALFEQQIASVTDTSEASHALEIASTALLLEISRAHDDVSSIERESIGNSIRQVFNLSEDEIEDIISTAEQAVDTAVSLYDFTSVVNERFSREQKVELLAKLWAVAFPAARY